MIIYLNEMIVDEYLFVNYFYNRYFLNNFYLIEKTYLHNLDMHYSTFVINMECHVVIPKSYPFYLLR